jgi:hypothetical protein
MDIAITFTTSCPDCDWQSEKVEHGSIAVADQQLREHIKEAHGGNKARVEVYID